MFYMKRSPCYISKHPDVFTPKVYQESNNKLSYHYLISIFLGVVNTCTLAVRLLHLPKQRTLLFPTKG